MTTQESNSFILTTQSGFVILSREALN